MRIQLSVLSAVLLVMLTAQSSAATKAPKDVLPLADVITKVTAALNSYQQSRGSGDLELPPLSSAEFDFKTTTAKSTSFSISILIFKFGTSHEKDVINDVTFTYAPPSPVKLQSTQPPKPPLTLADELAQTIQDAAAAVKASSTAAGLPFSKLTVNVSYGVKWDISADGKPVIQLVTLDLGGDANKNTVQSVKLTFGK